MDVATRLALFLGALVVAVGAGWGVGRLADAPEPDPAFVIHQDTHE